METSSKLSHAELAAIVHHIELNQAGWWDKAMQRIFLASVWLTDKSTNSKLRETFRSEFGLTISSVKVESIADTLETQNLLIRLPNGTFRIPDDRRSILEAEIVEAEESARNAQEYFFKLVKELSEELDPHEMWDAFDSIVLTPLIQETGANAYKLIAGEEVEVSEGLIDKFQSSYRTITRGQLVGIITRFLDPNHEATRSYVSRMLHATFCVQASGLPESVIEKLSNSIGKQIQFRLFVDTNFLFSILDLHDNPSNSIANELKDLISSMNLNIKVRLYVTSRTIKETKHSLLAAKSRLAGLPKGTNFNVAVSHAGFSGLDARFVEARTRKSGGLSPEDWFGPYLSNTVLLARRKGVDLFSEKLDQYATRQDVVDDIMNELEIEARKGPRRKNYETIEHDVILWHLVDDKRPSYVESPIDAKDWILTLDRRLIGFDERKRKASARLCTNLVKSVRVTGRLHQALQIDPRDFYPLGIGR